MQSHGRKVARFHLHDWLILMLLVVIEIGLNIIHPFYRFVGQDMMTDLKYPMKANTVPIWAVPVSFFVLLVYILYDYKCELLLYMISIIFFYFTDLCSVVAYSYFCVHLFQKERCL